MFGDFILKSGMKSPIYIDLRKITGNPILYNLVIETYIDRINSLDFDALIGIPMAGLPIVSAIAIKEAIPMCYIRSSKNYGTKNEFEGGVISGSKVLIVDDLVTRGTSVIEVLPKIKNKYQTESMLVLIDRESGGKSLLESHGIKLESIFTLTELLIFWKNNNLISNNEYKYSIEFISRD